MTTRPKPRALSQDEHSGMVRRSRASNEYEMEAKSDGQGGSLGQHHHHMPMHLPHYHPNGYKKTKGIHLDGESGRSGFHPLKFFLICFRSASTLSMIVNFLWPIVPAAIAVVRVLNLSQFLFLQRFHRLLIAASLSSGAMIAKNPQKLRNTAIIYISLSSSSTISP